MGCLFGCFRVSDDDRHIISSSVHSNRKNGERRPLSKNPLAAVFLREDGGSPAAQVASLGSQDRKLRREARFLKNCGALLETPVEIRKASENANSVDHSGTPSVHSWLPAMAGKFLFIEGQKAEDSQTPAGSHEHSYLPDAGSSTREGHEDSCQCDSDALSKPMHVEGVKNESGLDHRTEMITLNSSSFQREHGEIPPFGSNRSPFPTPLKVTDEMQTPATAYPTTLEKLRNGKNTRIRTQYVYPVLNPTEEFGKGEVLREGSYQPNQSQDQFEWEKNGSLDSEDQTKNTSQTSISEEYSISKGSEESILLSNKGGQSMSVASKGENLTTEATPYAIRQKFPLSQDPDVAVTSLSQWLKPPNPNKVLRHEAFTKDRSHSGKSSEEDRPIIGMVAAHWSDKEPESIPTKWWDGNGIPNSTNKYKEDQKVSWHATPFEERLEKALYDEKLQSQSKCSGGKSAELSGAEGEESDTAAS